MARYEVVREIQNECANNQMRDVFFNEIETDDPEGYVRGLLGAEKSLEITKEITDEENITVFANCAGTIQRFVFTGI